jgi:hypothetical protein
MFKQVFFFLFLFTGASNSQGQYFYYDDKYYDKDILWEAGASVGFMNAVADVGERKGHGLAPKYYDWKSSQLNYSIYFGILYKSIVEGRVELTRGKIAGADANSNSPFVRSRNLSYKSSIWEASLIATFHPLLLLNTEHLPAFSPYIMAGASVFSFYPKALYNGEWVPLRKMNTEGQTSPQYPSRKQYSLRALSIPVGLGLKYEFNAKFNIRMEGLYRFSNSDYLDDVSTTYVDRSIYDNDQQKILSHMYIEILPQEDRTGQPRGKAHNKDNFFSINLKIGYVIGRSKIPINYAPQ